METQKRTVAWRIARVASALFILAAIGALIMPEAWIFFTKSTVQGGIWPFSGAFGCYPEKEPCCLEGYNMTAMTDKWEDASPPVICRYFRYPIKEYLIMLSIVSLVVAAVAYASHKHAPQDDDKEKISPPESSSS
jgi:Mn2+/Fe2+ NRAMP family transporter